MQPRLDARLSRILRLMVARSFPRMRRLDIEIAWGAEEDLLYYAPLGARYEIRVNERLRGAPRRAIEGGLAHELCHIEADMRLGRVQKRLAWERYLRSERFEMREERAVERRVIELGWGAELLAFVRYARRLGCQFGRENGLLYGEIWRENARASFARL